MLQWVCIYIFLNYGYSLFYWGSLYCPFHLLHFLQVESLCQPCTEKSIGIIFFNSICSLHISVSHFSNFHNIANFFTIILFIMVIHDQWSLSSFCFWLHHMACGIFVPWPGTERRPSAVKEQSPNRWASREFPMISDLWYYCCKTIITPWRLR